MFFVVALVIAAFLGLIPASIAKSKGYSFNLWWLYGWMLFIVAIIHVSLIPNKNTIQMPYAGGSADRMPCCPPSSQSVAEELKKYKELFDQGVLTEEEFAAKKEQLLKMM